MSRGSSGWLGGVVRLARRFRYSQPLNWVSTTFVRAMLVASRRRPALVLKHLHRVGAVRSRLPNGRLLRLWSLADDWVSNQVYWGGWGSYESETAPLFFHLATRARVTLDVGAYVGFYTLLAAHANSEGQVFAFEPLPDAFERLRGNVARNGVANVECVKAGAGDSDGLHPFYLSTVDTIPCSSSLSRYFMRTARNLETINVKVLRLDDFARERGIGQVDLMKLDTEGTEPDVLRGALAILEGSRPTIVCEVLPGRGTEEALESILGPLGYGFYHLTPAGPEKREQIRGHSAFLNYLFTTRTADEIQAQAPISGSAAASAPYDRY